MLGDIPIDVTHKRIKNVHLSVYPPAGKVRISAPLHMNLDTIRVFAITKLGWIKRQQAALKKQDRETPREYLNRESHYYLGRRYLLTLVENRPVSAVVIKHTTLEIHQYGLSSPEKARNVLLAWYRSQLRELCTELIAKWEPRLGVKVTEFGIKVMKTKWGTCNPDDRRIWLNLELIKKPVECIEYIVVHELVHLLERKHGDAFVKLMTLHMPKWKSVREELNRSQLKNENWDY
jgi:predicted metal-dependent hydrolase